MSAAPFDPAAWLDGFTSAGGTYALTADDKLELIELFGGDGDKRGFVQQLRGQRDRIEAIKALVRRRCLIAESLSQT